MPQFNGALEKQHCVVHLYVRVLVRYGAKEESALEMKRGKESPVPTAGPGGNAEARQDRKCSASFPEVERRRSESAKDHHGWIGGANCKRLLI